MNNKSIIGIRIEKALLSRNMKQKDLAKILGVTDNTVSYYVSGKRTPNTEQIIKIATSLNISADWLLGLSDVQKPDTNVQAICEYTGLTEIALEVLRRNAPLPGKTEAPTPDLINFLLSNPDGDKLVRDIYCYLQFYMVDVLAVSESGRCYVLFGDDTGRERPAEEVHLFSPNILSNALLMDVQEQLKKCREAWNQKPEYEKFTTIDKLTAMTDKIKYVKYTENEVNPNANNNPQK